MARRDSMLAGAIQHRDRMRDSRLVRALLHVPYVPDVLFGGTLMAWGLADIINPEGTLHSHGWGAIRDAVTGAGLICFVFGLVHFIAGFLRVKFVYRVPACLLAAWGFAFLANASGSQTGHIGYGGYVVGEILICLRLLG